MPTQLGEDKAAAPVHSPSTAPPSATTTNFAPPETDPPTPTSVKRTHDVTASAATLPSGIDEKKDARIEIDNSVELPAGCERDMYERPDGTSEPVIWVDFPPGSTDNPFYFSKSRKVAITLVAVFFTALSAYQPAAFAISGDSMCRDLGCKRIIVEAGIALYAFGFGLFPLFLAPLSEEFGRRWTYVAALFSFFILNLMMTLGKNVATILICRFLIGGAGSIGATLVGGTLSDIYVPSQRGVPMAMFGFAAVFFTGLGGATMSWVEGNPRFEWRWVSWFQFIVTGAFLPVVVVVLRETRETVILRRRAAKLRKQRGLADGGRYTARSEITKPSFVTAVRTSCVRPLVFLTTEPLVMFFSLWVALGWGVFYCMMAGIPYVFRNIHGFNIIQSGQIYWSICIGAVIGFLGNFLNERVYRAKAPVKGVDARLYAPMFAGVFFAGGCFITGFTSISSVHWIGPCIGLAMLLAAIMSIYIATFTYLSECYGTYASSAMSAQSFLRNLFGGSFAFFTTAMFDGITARWGLVLMGGVAAILALVPFAAFFYGPQIRAHSRYSRQLMAEEHSRLEAERAKRAAIGMDMSDVQDLEGGANEATIERAESRHSMRSDRSLRSQRHAASPV